MWLFTECGFFSATRSAEHPAKMQVRARVRSDLEELMARYCDAPLPILEWPDRDYPYRVLMEVSQWSDIVSRMCTDVNYSNFKDRVKACQGSARAWLYSRIWSIMYEAEQKIPQEEDFLASFSTSTRAK
jgi:hypothetical protein